MSGLTYKTDGVISAFVPTRDHDLTVPFPAELLALANGMIYGPLWGTVLTGTGAVLGASGRHRKEIDFADADVHILDLLLRRATCVAVNIAAVIARQHHRRKLYAQQVVAYLRSPAQ